MNLVSLPNTSWRVPTILGLIAYLTTASVAHATMTCTWLDELSPISDPSILQKLEAHVRTLSGFKNYEIKPLQDHYFLVGAEGKFCKDIPRCEHRLLELRDGAVRNVFAFEGTGMVWRLWTPYSFWVENLGDDYSAWAFETTEHTYIRVDLPRSRDLVAISSPGAVEMKALQPCSNIKR